MLVIYYDFWMFDIELYEILIINVIYTVDKEIFF